jgi:UDP-sugar transporter A1/2/3
MDVETLKWLSLVIFTLQNAAFVLLMRASKVMAPTHYNSAVAVLVTEILKLPMSFLLLVYEKRSLVGAVRQIRADICGQPYDTLKISIPALLYTVQNNALFIAVGNLEAAVFQVTYQLKTLTTAVLTVLILGRKLLPHQWFALVLLTGGAALVQEPKKSAPTVGADGKLNASALLVGLSATVVACVCSALASVYLEKILTESKPSVWVRNTQLCLFTIPIAWVGTRFVDDPYFKEDGTPLHGFNGIVWACILTNAAGGMLVATVMKYAGNILRNFAQACAIIAGGLGSWLLFNFQITPPFVGGVFLVILSIFIYGSKVEQLTEWAAAIGLVRRCRRASRSAPRELAHRPSPCTPSALPRLPRALCPTGPAKASPNL